MWPFKGPLFRAHALLCAVRSHPRPSSALVHRLMDLFIGERGESRVLDSERTAQVRKILVGGRLSETPVARRGRVTTPPWSSARALAGLTRSLGHLAAPYLGSGWTIGLEPPDRQVGDVFVDLGLDPKAAAVDRPASGKSAVLHSLPDRRVRQRHNRGAPRGAIGGGRGACFRARRLRGMATSSSSCGVGSSSSAASASLVAVAIAFAFAARATCVRFFCLAWRGIGLSPSC